LLFRADAMGFVRRLPHCTPPPNADIATAPKQNKTCTRRFEMSGVQAVSPDEGDSRPAAAMRQSGEKPRGLTVRMSAPGNSAARFEHAAKARFPPGSTVFVLPTKVTFGLKADQHGFETWPKS
jgi:hypothetical protein